MSKKPIKSHIEQIQNISPEAMQTLETQRQVIDKMTEVLNQETHAYNQLHAQTKEKIVKGMDINHAQALVLDKKYEFLLVHIQDIYQRIDRIAAVLEHLSARV
jgi:hypothetical protein